MDKSWTNTIFNWSDPYHLSLYDIINVFQKKCPDPDLKSTYPSLPEMLKASICSSFQSSRWWHSSVSQTSPQCQHAVIVPIPLQLCSWQPPASSPWGCLRKVSAALIYKGHASFEYCSLLAWPSSFDSLLTISAASIHHTAAGDCCLYYLMSFHDWIEQLCCGTTFLQLWICIVYQ